MNADRDHDGRHHDGDLFGHADGRDDRIEREHDVENENLDDYRGK